MIFKDLKQKRGEKQWERKGRKDAFTWIHRYLRLHKELLEDPIYLDMYLYFRKALAEFLKVDLKYKKETIESLSELVDILADIFNRTGADRVELYKPIVEAIYRIWQN